MPNPRKDYKLYFLDILGSSRKVLRYTKSQTQVTFTSDQKTIDAVIRNFEIIGEAANKVPEKIKNEISDLPWKSMIGLRNKAIHEYFDVNIDIIWKTVKDDIPNLEKQISKIIEELDSNQPRLK